MIKLYDIGGINWCYHLVRYAPFKIFNNTQNWAVLNFGNIIILL